MNGSKRICVPLVSLSSLFPLFIFLQHDHGTVNKDHRVNVQNWPFFLTLDTLMQHESTVKYPPSSTRKKKRHSRARTYNNGYTRNVYALIYFGAVQNEWATSRRHKGEHLAQPHNHKLLLYTTCSLTPENIDLEMFTMKIRTSFFSPPPIFGFVQKFEKLFLAIWR